MKCDVLVINANPLLNLVHPGPWIPGAINRVPGLKLQAEGKGVNVARLLARFGHGVVLGGFAGGHSGAWLRELIRGEGVVDAFIETAAPVRMGFMASSPDEEHPTTFLPAGFPVTEPECERLMKCLAEWLQRVRLVIISGSAPSPEAASLYPRLGALCREQGVPCWLDAHGEGLMRALVEAGPWALAKPNRQEYQQAQGWERVEELHITDGDQAIEIRSQREGLWRVRPPAVRQVNPVGSGDCYLAGLAHGWLLGSPWPERLRWAVSAGAVNALRPDVAQIIRPDLETLADQVVIEPGRERSP